MAEIPGIQIESKTLDNKVWMHETSRPFGTLTHFTSQGDATNPSDSTVMSTVVGGGALLKLNHVAGVDSTEQHVAFDLNVLENKTYIHEGYMMWQGADFDTISMGIAPTITDTTAMSNTFFNVYNNYLLVPAAGDGSVNPMVDGTVGRVNLVEMPPSQDTGVRPQAFWNCPYDTTTHTFGDLTAAPAGDGTYNIFTAVTCLAKFANECLVVGDGFIMLQSADIHQIGHGMRMMLCSHTSLDTTDHNWKAGFILTLNREKTG